MELRGLELQEMFFLFFLCFGKEGLRGEKSCGKSTCSQVGFVDFPEYVAEYL